MCAFSLSLSLSLFLSYQVFGKKKENYLDKAEADGRPKTIVFCFLKRIFTVISPFPLRNNFPKENGEKKERIEKERNKSEREREESTLFLFLFNPERIILSFSQTFFLLEKAKF